MIEEKDHPIVNDMLLTASDRMCITQLINTSITDVINNKNTLVSKMESVMSLMREVECQEKAAEQAKEEASQSSLDVLVKLDDCKKTLRHEQEMNDMLVRKLYVQKAVLATKFEVMQLQTLHLLDDGDRLYEVLDEMTRSLEMRLTSASMKMELAIKKKQENEAFGRAALACEEIKMKKVEQDSKSLKKEAVEMSKVMEFLIDRCYVLDKLRGEISHNSQQLQEKLNQEDGIISSILASSKTSLKSFKLEENAGKDQELSNFNDFVATRELCGTKYRITKKNYLKRIKKVKIKGLQVVSKRMAAADHPEDDIIVLQRVLVIIIILIYIYVLEIFIV